MDDKKKAAAAAAAAAGEAEGSGENGRWRWKKAPGDLNSCVWQIHSNRAALQFHLIPTFQGAWNGAWFTDNTCFRGSVRDLGLAIETSRFLTQAKFRM